MPLLGYVSAIMWALYCVVTSTSGEVFVFNNYIGMMLGTLISTCIYFIIGKYILNMSLKKLNIEVTNWSKISQSSKRNLRAVAYILSPLSVLTYVLSLYYIDVTLSTVITSLYPILTIAIVGVVSKTKLSLLSKFSVVLATVGAVLVILSNTGIQGSSNIFGIILALISALCYALEPCLVDTISDTDPMSITYYKVSLFSDIAKVILVPLILVYLLVGSEFNYSFGPILSTLSAGAFMVLSYTYYFISIKSEGLAKAIKSNITYPIFVLALEIVMGNTSMSARMMAGIILILSSVIIDNPEF